MSVSVRLDVFEGPLDLLLHLVSKERVDVTEISIKTITQEYLDAMKRMPDVELETASSFLILAATLMELKSMRLLPDRSVEDPEIAALLEERDRLIHRLIQYSTFKRASSFLESSIEANRSYYFRLADVPEEVVHLTPDLLEGITAEMLAGAARDVFAPRIPPTIDTSHVGPIKITVADVIDSVLGEVKAQTGSSFEEICRRVTTRLERIVRFLALLELYREERVDIEQKQPFGEIVVRLRNPMSGRAK